VLAVRCRRDPTLRRPREACPARHPELRRYRDVGASAAGLFTSPPGDLVADDFYNTRLMEDPAQAVVLEGDTPVGAVDLRVYVAPPPGPGQTLLIRQLRDHAQQQQNKLHALQPLLDQPDGIQHAGLVIINLTDHAQRDRAQALLAELQRLRTDRQVFDDVLGWQGRRTPITAVAADLSDPKDPGTRKAVARALRIIRSASQP
jgi:cell division inhibitor SulA